MIKKQYKSISATFLAVMLGTSGAFAGVCQVTSGSWTVQQFCGLQSRGYGKGTNSAFGTGQKGLAALSTGVSGGFSSVAAQAVNSAGQQITGCGAVDNIEDGSDLNGNGGWAIGGACQQGVKFIVQITF